ncbi:hypothetical protein GGTG_02376 [Gaeumannomyces tritici R3-111a-1]|uniref:Uncharacterized protein n=1 Tax=Gaeumannomyces tritici (strain R3-111a-1) TaxID=644352 RepID=J3NM72_GAET3|nr:hypothetical protein GGTG_02376 [Gaeumannomyces tritici R3-111a-1]EJT82403.1 hypothetical protein GGTG_02376 [Gaeumannomyces tritici R3-111a-1]
MRLAGHTQFGRIDTRSVVHGQGLTKYFATEHILEYQAMFSSRGFWGIVLTMPDPTNRRLKFAKKTILMNGNKKEFKKMVIDEYGPGLDEMTVDGIKGRPMQILSYGYPNSKYHRSGLVLLDQPTNGLKETIMSPGKKAPRTDETINRYINNPNIAAKAFFVLKHMMFAMEYMTTEDIYREYIKQVLREAKYMQISKTSCQGARGAPPAPKESSVDDIDSKLKNMNIDNTPSKPPPAAIPID